LTAYDDFLTFVTSFNSPKLRVCIDTCHVFASGQNPLDYIKKMMAADPDLVRLVHFNDSATPCGSCADRHAFIGTGKIARTFAEGLGFIDEGVVAAVGSRTVDGGGHGKAKFSEPCRCQGPCIRGNRKHSTFAEVELEAKGKEDSLHPNKGVKDGGNGGGSRKGWGLRELVRDRMAARHG
jgi:hypothetical protein